MNTSHSAGIVLIRIAFLMVPPQPGIWLVKNHVSSNVYWLTLWIIQFKRFHSGFFSKINSIPTSIIQLFCTGTCTYMCVVNRRFWCVPDGFSPDRVWSVYKHTQNGEWLPPHNIKGSPFLSESCELFPQLLDFVIQPRRFVEANKEPYSAWLFQLPHRKI